MNPGEFPPLPKPDDILINPKYKQLEHEKPITPGMLMENVL